ncbi:TPA: DUF192 domain-containing protein [Candidatus Poribacteria bacterium]|nr:DUF192 domain-containing protein [Candidatus Poribacteria bacterium]
MFVTVVDRTKDRIVGERIKVADTFWSRFLGLLGRKGISPGEGVLLLPCSSVHTLFMRFAIDVLFLDERMKVVKVLPSLKPYRFSPIVRGAHSVLELAEGEIERIGIEVGDLLEVISG